MISVRIPEDRGGTRTDGVPERAWPRSGLPFPRTKRARACARATLLPPLVAMAVLVWAVAAQGLPVQAAAGHQLSAPAGPRPSLVRHGHAGDPFGPDRRLSGGVSGPAAADMNSAAGPFGSFGSALAGSAPVQSGPSAVAVDRATDTIYVASGNNADGPNPANPPNTIAVIDGRHCQGSDVSRCKGPWPTVKVGNLPAAVTVDQVTGTVYVTNVGGNTVSVIDGATCNALVSSGCGQRTATVPVGAGPVGIFADHADHTVYVANFGDNTVSMIDSATCNGSHLTGCPSQPPPTVAVGGGPGDIDVNEVTHSVYVTTLTGLSVFAENTCNATDRSGCGEVGTAVAPGVGTPACTSTIPSCGGFAAKVDPDNNTIYEADGTTTVTVFDGRTCQAGDLAGCATQTPGTVTVAPPADVGFEVAIWVAVDLPLHTVYVVNQKDDDLSAIDADVCNGRHLAACASLQPPTIHTGEDPESVALDPDTQTLYTANQVTNDVSVIDASQCNAAVTAGCRQAPPAVALPGPGALAADPAVGTTYVANGVGNGVSMINSQTCNAYVHEGCTPTPPMVIVGAGPAGITVDRQTNTVYVANSGSGATGSISVFDDRTCNATTASGCGNVHTLQVPGGNTGAIAVDPATDTVYVTTIPGSGPSTVSVFNGATCNATHSGGCAQVPQSVMVGFSAFALAVDAVTDTIYVANFADSTDPFGGNTVSVIDGATCNATDTTGCAAAPQTITLGPPDTTPAGVAIDPATDTIYVADLQDGEGSGAVSVINGAACNAVTSAGCGQTPPTVTVGFGPFGIAFDPANRTVVVTNQEDTSVSVIDVATCNAVISSSCGSSQLKLAVGRAPTAVAVDPAVGTIYVSNGDGTVSIIPAIR
jgi:YVTN family beta-propeller protein